MRKFTVYQGGEMSAPELLKRVFEDEAQGIHPLLDEFLTYNDLKKKLNTMSVSRALRVCSLVLRAVESHFYVVDMLDSPNDYL